MHGVLDDGNSVLPLLAAAQGVSQGEGVQGDGLAPGRGESVNPTRRGRVFWGAAVRAVLIDYAALYW